MTGRAKLRSAVVAALAGGSVFGACEARLKDALVGGSTSYLLSPSGFLADIGLEESLVSAGLAEGDDEARDDSDG